MNRLREAKELTQGHRASEWENRDSSQSADTEAHAKSSCFFRHTTLPLSWALGHLCWNGGGGGGKGAQWCEVGVACCSVTITTHPRVL